MAHHKRGKPKFGRAGCLLCKPHKQQGAPLTDRQRHSQNRKIKEAEEKRKEET